MDRSLLGFIQALRCAGVPVSVAETLDGAAIADLLGFADRAALKQGLRAALAKTAEETARFDACFERYFAAFAVEAPSPAGPEPDGAAVPGNAGGVPIGFGSGMADLPADGLSPLSRLVRARDMAGLLALLGRALEERRAPMRSRTQRALVARRLLERIGLAAYEEDVRRLRADGADAAAAALELGRAWMTAAALRLTERRMMAEVEAEAARIGNRDLARTALRRLSPADERRVHELVRALARRFAALYGRRRRLDRRTVLDARRTLRKGVRHNGILFETVWRTRRRDRPRLFVLCDVSGSMSTVATLFLTLVAHLHDGPMRVRAFAFSDRLGEITDDLEDGAERGMAAAVTRWGGGSTDYGQAFADFLDLCGDAVDGRSTLVVLGDARNNNQAPRLDLLKRIAARARDVLWLNPEPPVSWGSGDSVAPLYAAACGHALPCGTIAQMEAVIENLMGGAPRAAPHPRGGLHAHGS
ncbi:VWA domain-containing protein [Azospirillum sp.]|uniref:VWA domain-containing protein n=1 Tax=Azospirillum sp. TaxID=34012 RepID=UPI003D7279C8